MITVVNVILALRSKKYREVTCVLLVIFISQILLHFVYSYQKAFLYAPHYLFILYFLIGIGLSEIKTRKVRFVEGILLMLVLTVYVLLIVITCLGIYLNYWRITWNSLSLQLFDSI